MTRVAAAVGALALVISGCSDDDGDSAVTTTTAIQITLGQGLPVGASYEDPTGNVTLTVNGIRLTGGLLLADAEACAAEDALPGLPIQAAAWQLRVRGADQPVPRILLDDPVDAARPVWPDSVELAPGDCFSGKVAFRLPEDGRPMAVIFTQLNPPVAWRVRS
jgi:hypothetical protein